MVKEVTQSVVRKVAKAFKTDDVFWDSEVEANRLVALTMCNSAILLAVVWVLNYVGIFTTEQSVMNSVAAQGILELLIPALICIHFHGEKHWLKYVLLIELVVVLARVDSILTFNVPLLIVLPVILSVRYYSRKLTAGIALLTTVLFIMSAYFASAKLMGSIDLNYYFAPVDITIPAGMPIDTVKGLAEVIAPVYAKEYMLKCCLPKLLIFSVIAIACSEVARRGHDMVLEQAEISTNTARIESELSTAKDIQAAMLPSIFPPFPEHKELDIYATMDPAKEVGGDFYDCIKIDDDHIGVVMADVSGKGIPAALFMMISKTLIKNQVQTGASVADVFTTVNAQLTEGNDTDFFVTAWLGVYEISSGKLSFCNAGHNPPLVCHKGGDFEFVRDRHGIVLSAVPGVKYTMSEMTLKPGDTLFLYTDGVTESMDTADNMYQEDRLKAFLNAHRGNDSKSLLEGLSKDLAAFVGDAVQFDDITMLSMRIV